MFDKILEKKKKIKNSFLKITTICFECSSSVWGAWKPKDSLGYASETDTKTNKRNRALSQGGVQGDHDPPRNLNLYLKKNLDTT